MRSSLQIWEAALGELQLQVNKPNYNTWLKDTKGISCENNLFIIGAPNAFVAEWLETRLLSLIQKTLASIIGNAVEVQFLIKSMVKTDVQPIAPLQTDGGLSTRTARHFKLKQLNARWTFDSFITGESNRLAYAAALDTARNPGQVYNPLFIYGGTGLGKSHLLHAIGNALRENSLNVICASAEQLTTEYVNAIKNGQTEEFNNRYRNADVLLVDDFQFFSGKAHTQQGFFHVFNDLYENNRQIVITCDKPPRSIESIHDKLRSRLEGGLVADIKSPEIETRLAILKYHAGLTNMLISDDVFGYIAEEFSGNVRELEGGFNRVLNYAKLNNLKPNIEHAVKALAPLNGQETKTSSEVSPEHIIHIVSRYFDISTEAITGKRRDKKTVLARQVAMYLLREHNHFHLSDIGKLFGGKDHTTVLYSCEKVAAEISTNSDLNNAVSEIQRQLYPSHNPQHHSSAVEK